MNTNQNDIESTDDADFCAESRTLSGHAKMPTPTLKSLTESAFGLHPGALSEPIIGRSSEALADARAAFVVAAVLMAPDRLKREISKEAGLTESGLHYARTRGQYMLQTDRAFRAKVARIVQGVPA